MKLDAIKKIGGRFVKTISPLKPVLKVFNFLKPSMISVVLCFIFLGILIVSLIFTTNSSCEINQDGSIHNCKTHTITGWPFWINILTTAGAAYLLGHGGYWLYKKLFVKTFL